MSVFECVVIRVGVLMLGRKKIVSTESKNLVLSAFVSSFTGHILDLYCIRLSNAAPFYNNYAKLYFDAKHLEKGLNKGGGEILGALFFKKCPFF